MDTTRTFSTRLFDVNWSLLLVYWDDDIFLLEYIHLRGPLSHALMSILWPVVTDSEFHIYILPSDLRFVVLTG